MTGVTGTIGAGVETAAIWMLWALAGAAVAALNLALARRSIAVLTGGGGRWPPLLSLALRLALAGGTMWLAVQHGAAALLAAAAGFAVLRAAILARAAGEDA